MLPIIKQLIKFHLLIINNIKKHIKTNFMILLNKGNLWINYIRIKI